MASSERLTDDSEPEGDPPKQAGNGGDVELPAAFLSFLAANNINPDVYKIAYDLPRFIRVRPTSNLSPDILSTQLSCPVTPVPWLPSFFQLPGTSKIATSGVYRQGLISGIDVSSGAAVAALGVQRGDHCLDLCCAPGAKLCYVADLVGSEGSVTGVDVAQHRLAACKTDGTTFNIGPPDPTSTPQPPHENTNTAHKRTHVESEGNGEVKRKKLSKRQKGRLKKAQAEARAKEADPSEPQLVYRSKGWAHGGETKEMGYDKVLVDAECTHDGSLKHVAKFREWGWDTFERRFMDAARIQTITQLQRSLLRQGFMLLKPGGVLVYSTCSLTVAQNEDVVDWFLANEPLAELQPIECEGWPATKVRGHCLRFDPVTSNTSGLFVAKIGKKVVDMIE